MKNTVSGHIDYGKYLIQTLHPEFGWGLEANPFDTLADARRHYDATVRANYPGGCARIVQCVPLADGGVRFDDYTHSDDSKMMRNAKYTRA